MALPAHDDYLYDPEFSSDVSTTVRPAARPSRKTSTRRRNARHNSSSNRLPQRVTVSQSAPQSDDEIAHSYREVLEEAREDGAVAIVSHRSRRGHRAFRMTWPIGIALSILFAQLLGVLWLKSVAVSASHRDGMLEGKMKSMQSQIDKTQGRIAVLENDPRMATWAAKSGYRPMAQSVWDDISKPAAPIEYSNGKPPAANDAKPQRP